MVVVVVVEYGDVFVGCSLLLAGWLAGWLSTRYLTSTDRAQASGPVNSGLSADPAMPPPLLQIGGGKEMNHQTCSLPLQYHHRSGCAYKAQLMHTNNRLPTCTDSRVWRFHSMHTQYIHTYIQHTACKRSVFLVVCTTPAPATPT